MQVFQEKRYNIISTLVKLTIIVLIDLNNSYYGKIKQLRSHIIDWADLKKWYSKYLTMFDGLDKNKMNILETSHQVTAANKNIFPCKWWNCFQMLDYPSVFQVVT